MRVADFDYELPAALIAQHPPAQRDQSRMLVLNGTQRHDASVQQLPQWLRPGDVLVLNNTKVIKARLHGHKPSGGQVEVLVEHMLDQQHFLAMARANKPLRPGQKIQVGPAELELLTRTDAGYHFRVAGLSVAELIDAHGHWPLPPYITRADMEEDAERYQTVYAERPGAIAAPTAGLHFTPELLTQLQALGVIITEVTLHVGAGTFKPVQVEDTQDHVMHREWCEVPAHTVAHIERAHAQGHRVVAVGTTSLRALESAALTGQLQAGTMDTQLFITPGFAFQVVDVLLTNFHLPRSTLLMLVSAFAGQQAILSAYQHAISQQYRFFSYGDAMLLHRQPTQG